MVVQKPVVECHDLVQVPHSQDGRVQCIVVADGDEGVAEGGVLDMRDGPGVGLEATEDAAGCVSVYEEHLPLIITHDEGGGSEAAADDVEIGEGGVGGEWLAFKEAKVAPHTIGHDVSVKGEGGKCRERRNNTVAMDEGSLIDEWTNNKRKKRGRGSKRGDSLLKCI